MNNDKKLFLLDAFALIYRAYFAFSKTPRVTSYGLNTSAIFGFTNTVVDLLHKEKPSHLAVVFDTPEETQRHTDFTAYKANRAEVPEDIVIAVPFIKRILEGFDIPVIELPGYEADDLVGTLAKKAEKLGYAVYMVTPDKDYAQLVSENIFIYKPARSGGDVEILGVKEVCEKFEVENPLQVIDFLGMMGDSVDNIPGLPGVGEKTAKQFIKEFGSIENLLANTDKVKGKLREKIEENKELGIMSKKLATIILDAPMEFEEEKTLIGNFKLDILSEVFNELEFRNLAKRIIPNLSGNDSEDKPASNAKILSDPQQTSLFDGDLEPTEIYQGKTIENTDHNYQVLESSAELENLIEEIKKQGFFAWDTETTNLEAIDAELVGVSIALKSFEAFYIPFDDNKAETERKLSIIRTVLEDEKIEKIGQNIKYDMTVMKNYGIKLKGPLFDTMIAHYLLQPDMKHNMDALSQAYLGYTPVSIEDLIGKKGKNQRSMRDVPIEKIKEYAAEDADVTLQLSEIFRKDLKENQLFELFQNVEMPLTEVLMEMETEGINIDVKALQNFSKELEGDLITTEEKIYELAGVHFNIASPKQLGDILFEHLKIDSKAKKTKTGQYATDEDTLAKYANAHPVIGQIMEFRQLQKLKSTYVDSLPLLVNKKTNRLHTSYNQAVAATGRLSSNNPNLQNIPIRTKRGREVRKAFIPKNEDYCILSADYSQVELRIIAALSGDENLIEAFVAGKDIHTATASKVFGVPLEEVDRDMRSKAKAVNFGIIYGQGAFGLAQNLNISRTEAKEIIDNYFTQFPKLKAYQHKVIELARENGYVETVLKRKRYLADINSQNAIVKGYAERNAINAPIQGSAADIIKVAMIKIQNRIENEKLESKMLLQVHDELVFDAKKTELEKLKEILKDCMMNAVKLSVPLEIEIGTGENWLSAH